MINLVIALGVELPQKIRVGYKLNWLTTKTLHLHRKCHMEYTVNLISGPVF